MSRPVITPIADGEPFEMSLLHEAADLAREDPARLTDLHLRHVATYDKGAAVEYAEKRDAAQLKALALAEKTLATPPGPRVLTVNDLPWLTDAIGTAIGDIAKEVSTHAREELTKELDALRAELNAALQGKFVHAEEVLAHAEVQRTQLLHTIAERKKSEEILRDHLALLEARVNYLVMQLAPPPPRGSASEMDRWPG